MLRLAAGDAGRDRGDRGAAVDSIADERQATSAQMPLLKFADEQGDEPLERLRRRFGMGSWFLQPKRRAGRRLGWRGGQRLGLAAERPVERIDDILPTAKPPRQRK